MKFVMINLSACRLLNLSNDWSNLMEDCFTWTSCGQHCATWSINTNERLLKRRLAPLCFQSSHLLLKGASHKGTVLISPPNNDQFRRRASITSRYRNHDYLRRHYKCMLVSQLMKAQIDSPQGQKVMLSFRMYYHQTRVLSTVLKRNGCIHVPDCRLRS